MTMDRSFTGNGQRSGLTVNLDNDPGAYSLVSGAIVNDPISQPFNTTGPHLIGDGAAGNRARRPGKATST